MKYVKIFRYVLLAIFLPPGTGLAQSSQQDSSFVDISIARAAGCYIDEFPGSVLIYTGRSYVDYDDGIKGFPYFHDEYFTEGSITVNGKRFDNLMLKYDCLKDKLIIENNPGSLELITDKIDVFEIYGYRFFHLRDEPASHGDLKAGLYNILYDGEVKVYSKRHKTYFEEASSRELHREFLLKDKFYVVVEGTVKRVRTQASVLHAFKDRKREIKQSLKKQGIYFQADFEKAVITAAALYDELKGL